MTLEGFDDGELYCKRGVWKVDEFCLKILRLYFVSFVTYILTFYIIIISHCKHIFPK